MDPLNFQGLNLSGCVGSSASAAKVVKKQETPVESDDDRLLVPSAEFPSFPADISHLVGEYLPMKERSYVETAFAGVQPITLCLSQDVNSNLISCWDIGFLPPNRQWKPSDGNIDKEYLIQDYEGCLELLEHDNPNYCQVVIEVLIVKLNKTSKDLLGALNDLRITIEKLKHHLSSVKQVVISVRECFSCNFTLKDVFDVETGKLQPVDPVNALITIVKDLKTCWKRKKKLTVFQMFKFYFKRRAKLASDMYLEKFVVPLYVGMNLELFHREASKMLSTKIMWILFVEFDADLLSIDQNVARLCHAVYLDFAHLTSTEELELTEYLERKLCLQDNPFVERIVIISHEYGRAMPLPRPSEPLTKATPRSALIELSKKGNDNYLHLSHLNNGYFPHLVHLSVIGGEMTGHLDSQSVPSLKTLKIGLTDRYGLTCLEKHALVLEKTQSLIDTGRPWQLVASKNTWAWSLASYDEPTANPQDEVKEDAPRPLLSLPVIRELMLVMTINEFGNEFRSKLKDISSLEAAAGYQDDGLLVWAPERVEKISAFSIFELAPELEFRDKIPGQTRILTSLECHYVDVMVHGNVLPRLQSLTVHGGNVWLSGAFPQLKTLSLEDTEISSPWDVDAFLLETFNFDKSTNGKSLFLRPQLLPHLYYLRITLYDSDIEYCPSILLEGDHSGLSGIDYVVFGKGMTGCPDFDQWQLQNVSHLKLAVDACKLPARWLDTDWQCETWTIHAYGPPVEHIDSEHIDSKHSDSNDSHSDSSDDDSSVDESAPKKEPPVFTLPLKLPLLEKLTVTELDCKVILDSELPNLTDLTVPSPESLGPNLKCPLLKRICFTGKLSPIEKDLYLDRATYVKMGAHLSVKWVYFEMDGEAKRMF